MKILIYFIIFISKAIELALGTLRIIVIANGKKVLGAILQGVIAIVWVCITGVVIVNVIKDPLKIVAFALGSTFGSYLGSIIEEKIALGTNMLIAIINKDLEDILCQSLRHKKHPVTVLDAKGMYDDKTILLIMTERKKRKEIVNIIKSYQNNPMIIVGNAFTISDKYRK